MWDSGHSSFATDWAPIISSLSVGKGPSATPENGKGGGENGPWIVAAGPITALVVPKGALFGQQLRLYYIGDGDKIHEVVLKMPLQKSQPIYRLCGMRAT